MPSSFLNDFERIASRNYGPSDEDVVRARSRTLGVQEYKIEFAPDNVNQNIFSGTSISFCLSTLLNEALSIGAMAGVDYEREWRLYHVFWWIKDYGIIPFSYLVLLCTCHNLASCLVTIL